MKKISTITILFFVIGCIPGCGTLNKINKQVRENALKIAQQQKPVIVYLRDTIRIARSPLTQQQAVNLIKPYLQVSNTDFFKPQFDTISASLKKLSGSVQTLTISLAKQTELADKQISLIQKQGEDIHGQVKIITILKNQKDSADKKSIAKNDSLLVLQGKLILLGGVTNDSVKSLQRNMQIIGSVLFLLFAYLWYQYYTLKKEVKKLPVKIQQ